MWGGVGVGVGVGVGGDQEEEPGCHPPPPCGLPPFCFGAQTLGSQTPCPTGGEVPGGGGAVLVCDTPPPSFER